MLTYNQQIEHYVSLRSREAGEAIFNCLISQLNNKPLTKKENKMQYYCDHHGVSPYECMCSPTRHFKKVITDDAEATLLREKHYKKRKKKKSISLTLPGIMWDLMGDAADLQDR